jgi:hypothetical protein
MSRIDDLLAGEGEAAENHPDTAPLPERVTVTRPGAERATVVSVRLGAEEHAQLQAAANRAHLPVSTLIRIWTIDRLTAEERFTAEEQGRSATVNERLARLEAAVFSQSA